MSKLSWISLGVSILGILIYVLLVSSKQPVTVAIAPHHNIAKSKRLEMLQKISVSNPSIETIILISPDHFSPYQDKISYTDQDWSLKNGFLSYDKEISGLITDGLLLNNVLQTQEHGIYNLMADIGNIWPKTAVIPLAIGSKVNISQLNLLHTKLNKLCVKDCLLIASVDFSHYLPADLADIHDQTSIRVLENLEIDAVSKLEVDSWQSLYLAILKAKAYGQSGFKLFSHSNSSRMIGNPELESTSHIMGWFSRDKQFPSRNYQTFTYANNLDKTMESDGLGERLFWGNDFSDFKINKNIKIGDSLSISPVAGTRSAVVRQEGNILVRLADDLIISGIVHENGIELIFYPIENINGKHYFLRGVRKQEILNELINESIFKNKINKIS